MFLKVEHDCCNVPHFGKHVFSIIKTKLAALKNLYKWSDNRAKSKVENKVRRNHMKNCNTVEVR